MGKTVLITGANRGVGLELTKAYLEKGWRVIAAVRDPSKMKIEGDVMVVKLEVGEKEDAKKAVEEIKRQGIENIDVVIANAAVNLGCGVGFKDIDVELQEETFRINVRGPLLLFQATLGLLGEKGKFVTISSGAGTIGQKHGKVNAIYGQSKAAVNFFISKIHYEHPDLIVLALNPGWVPTEMGNEGAVLSGMKEAPEKFSDTIPGMLNVIESAKKDTTSGKMINWTTERSNEYMSPSGPNTRLRLTDFETKEDPSVGDNQNRGENFNVAGELIFEEATKETTSGRMVNWHVP